MAKNIINQYDPNFVLRSPIFSDIAMLLREKNWQQWPTLEDYMDLVPEGIKNSAGHSITMHHQYQDLPFPEMGYEERIYKSGIISTREQNWHDFFNVFIWCFFPRTKVLLNRLHMDELEIQVGKKRTPARDAITHIDESGVIVATCEPEVIQELKRHQWKQLFVQRRQQWWKRVGCYVFGHGLYEKALNPFIGFTGKAYCLLVEEAFFNLSRLEQYRELDKTLLQHIDGNQSLKDSSHLSPIPVLGVPEWYAENSDPNFYRNENYFRPFRGVRR